MKNKFITKSLAIILSLAISLTPVYAMATDQVDLAGILTNDKYGQIALFFPEGEGHETYLQVYVKGDNLYANAASFAKKFGYITSETDSSVQFLQTVNEEGEEYRWTLISNFEIDSKDVWLSDGKSITDYEAPFKTIKNDKGTWIPLQFAIKLMGRELFINKGIINVSKPHQTKEMILRSVDRTESDFMDLLVASNRTLSDSEAAIDMSPLYTEAIACESKKNEWLYDAVARSSSLSSYSDEGYGELATYLVANLGPENSAVAAEYYEMIQMYLSQDIAMVGADLLGEALDLEEGGSIDLAKAATKVQLAAEELYNENPANIAYNDAFKRTYMDFAGYNPVTGEISDSLVYEEMISAMITCNGNPSKGAYESVKYFGSFLGPLGNFSSVFAGTFAQIHTMRNRLAENDYSKTRFADYIANGNPHYNSNMAFIGELDERVNNYQAYQDEIANEYIEKSREDIFSDVVDGYKDDLISEALGSFGLLGKGIGYLLDTKSFFDDANEYFETMEEIANDELLANNGAYLRAKSLAEEIGHNAVREQNYDWAYLFYRTEFVSNFYYEKALSKAVETGKLSLDEAIETDILLNELMEEDKYHLASIRIGVEYGLSPEDNEDYNRIYDDTKLLEYVEEIDLSLGNTSANINAGGFVVTSDDYYYYVDQADGYSLNYNEINGDGEFYVCEGPVHWLNLYYENGIEYLYYINKDGKIGVLNQDNGHFYTVDREGSFSYLMVAGNNLFAIKDGDLVKLETYDWSNYGDVELVANDVNECICYEDGTIYYSDLTGQVHTCDYNGENVEDLDIYSKAFDVRSGNIYFANMSDNNRLYVYNTLTGFSSLMNTTQDIYNISYYKGLVYFKVDDGKSSSLVYSAVPFMNKSIERVFSWQGPDDTFGFEMKDSTSCGRDSRRLYNIANGKIYNEGYTWKLVDHPIAGVNIKTAIGFGGYKLSRIISGEEELTLKK